LKHHVEEFLKKKQPGQIDSKEIQQIKGLIRQGEARAGARCCGIPNEKLHFMNMPFYETGGVKKKPARAKTTLSSSVDLLRKAEAASDLRGRRPDRSARHSPHMSQGDHSGV
jgi:glucosamine-6-phosphate deaminase